MRHSSLDTHMQISHIGFFGCHPPPLSHGAGLENGLFTPAHATAHGCTRKTLNRTSLCFYQPHLTNWKVRG
ncbi:hypothetical protein GALMADRAFT_458200 [Galerina marginata CBS 339.88]|uniref:Uncharacterized protein n=1 Tax=Galerina marginata (strain CBS 339.88) TaxID=685588 RepID=A0A067T135_GALM3|nr:hypothetical protein GALMADRAFT_458200 [Galerina marginata CBS 339.88]